MILNMFLICKSNHTNLLSTCISTTILEHEVYLQAIQKEQTNHDHDINTGSTMVTSHIGACAVFFSQEAAICHALTCPSSSFVSLVFSRCRLLFLFLYLSLLVVKLHLSGVNAKIEILLWETWMTNVMWERPREISYGFIPLDYTWNKISWKTNQKDSYLFPTFLSVIKTIVQPLAVNIHHKARSFLSYPYWQCQHPTWRARVQWQLYMHTHVCTTHAHNCLFFPWLLQSKYKNLNVKREGLCEYQKSLMHL